MIESVIEHFRSFGPSDPVQLLYAGPIRFPLVFFALFLNQHQQGSVDRFPFWLCVPLQLALQVTGEHGTVAADGNKEARIFGMLGIVAEYLKCDREIDGRDLVAFRDASDDLIPHGFLDRQVRLGGQGGKDLLGAVPVEVLDG